MTWIFALFSFCLHLVSGTSVSPWADGQQGQGFFSSSSCGWPRALTTRCVRVAPLRTARQNIFMWALIKTFRPLSAGWIVHVIGVEKLCVKTKTEQVRKCPQGATFVARFLLLFMSLVSNPPPVNTVQCSLNTITTCFAFRVGRYV